MSEAIANKIIQIAKVKGKNITELESEVELSRGYLRRVTRGAIQELKINHITRIAQALEVSVSDLISGAESIIKNEIHPLRYNRKLYNLVESFVAEELEERNTNFFSSALYNAKYEIYKYCLEEKEGEFDRNFANFLLNRVGNIR